MPRRLLLYPQQKIARDQPNILRLHGPRQPQLPWSHIDWSSWKHSSESTMLRLLATSGASDYDSRNDDDDILTNFCQVPHTNKLCRDLPTWPIKTMFRWFLRTAETWWAFAVFFGLLDADAPASLSASIPPPPPSSFVLLFSDALSDQSSTYVYYNYLYKSKWFRNMHTCHTPGLYVRVQLKLGYAPWL